MCAPLPGQLLFQVKESGQERREGRRAPALLQAAWETQISAERGNKVLSQQTEQHNSSPLIAQRGLELSERIFILVTQPQVLPGLNVLHQTSTAQAGGSAWGHLLGWQPAGVSGLVVEPPHLSANVCPEVLCCLLEDGAHC